MARVAQHVVQTPSLRDDKWGHHRALRNLAAPLHIIYVTVQISLSPELLGALGLHWIQH